LAQVALAAGNSPKIIFLNYRELVRPAEAEKWFSIQTQQPDTVRLEPGMATCEGALHMQVNEGRPNIGFWDSSGDRLHWLVPVISPGRYTLRGEFSSANGSSDLKVTMAGQSKSAEAPQTDGWFKPQFVSFGEFEFAKSGVFHLVLEPSSPDRWRAVNVYQIQLAAVVD
jgi:hypothetical protein